MDVQKDAGGNGKDDQLGRNADSVDRKAAQPFLDVASVGAEDEVLIAEKGHGNADRLGGDRGDVYDQRLAEVRHQMAVQNHAGRVESQREDCVRDANHQETNDLN